MKRIESGFSLVELILAMFVATVFLFLLGSVARHMVSTIDSEQQLMTVEQDARKIHEYVSRVMRDASAASVQTTLLPCGILQFSTTNFGGGVMVHRWYTSQTAPNELYEESAADLVNLDCAAGNLITDYYDPTSVLTMSNNVFEWMISLTDGVETIPVRIIVTPRNL